jgi:hypothetical protein
VTGKAKRDDYEMDQTDERHAVLAMAVRKELITDPSHRLLTRDTLNVLAPSLLTAHRELSHAGLIYGIFVTGKGYAAAIDWGIVQDPHEKLMKGKP